MGKPKKWKRKGPKSTRSGCLMCKPHKDQSIKDTAAGKRWRDLKADARLLDEMSRIT